MPPPPKKNVCRPFQAQEKTLEDRCSVSSLLASSPGHVGLRSLTLRVSDGAGRGADAVQDALTLGVQRLDGRLVDPALHRRVLLQHHLQRTTRSVKH